MNAGLSLLSGASKGAGRLMAGVLSYLSVHKHLIEQEGGVGGRLRRGGRQDMIETVKWKQWNGNIRAPCAFVSACLGKGEINEQRDNFSHSEKRV